MFAEFFVRALVAGLGVALVSGPLGCFVIWRRMAYFGETMAHASLLGVSLGLLLDLPLPPTVFATAVLVALALLGLERLGGLSTDALLGILSHASLALGLVAAALVPNLRVDLMSFLFGDILAVTWFDVAVVFGGGLGALGVLALFWRQLLASTVSPEIASAEGMKPGIARLILVVLVAAVVAVSIKIVGVLLITAMLVIPAATARRVSPSPEVMAVASSLCGMAAVVAGLFASLNFDLPPGPAIVAAALLVFLASLAVPRRLIMGSR
ncbi:metal ABC transporter permease [Antarcticirhabdus aurantiaca]|uniref:Metal ABC transporter permease n=1 Tax=Antarcticirhabdus aurantiaca TaxID=2606717 RepID=A0ACD4NIE3_9HYPH|nr:metal ABC transporter permease [Antarcticirhabdus aurantiaca]WAJ26587.1 metal ABC transporter permease [Jeongeuplla avenae]